VTVPLAFALATLPLWHYAIIVVLVTVVGIWAADRADRAWGTHDSGRIVIDEVAGYLVTMALVDRGHWAPLVVGFVVFRALDIIKPPPVRWLDRNLPGGFGVVIDDVAAGVLGMVIMLALDRFGALARLASI
jgi:phosphatidylglycerophosphatase A